MLTLEPGQAVIVSHYWLAHYYWRPETERGLEGGGRDGGKQTTLIPHTCADLYIFCSIMIKLGTWHSKQILTFQFYCLPTPLKTPYNFCVHFDNFKYFRASQPHRWCCC